MMHHLSVLYTPWFCVKIAVEEQIAVALAMWACFDQPRACTRLGRISAS